MTSWKGELERGSSELLGKRRERGREERGAEVELFRNCSLGGMISQWGMKRKKEQLRPESRRPECLTGTVGREVSHTVL